MEITQIPDSIQTTLAESKEAPKIQSYSEWIKKNFNQKDSKCIKQNQAVFVCIDFKCTKENPFICNVKKCQCVLSHKLCSIRNYQSFLQEINSKKQVAFQVQDKVETLLDNLVDAISDMKENLLKRLSQGQMNNYLVKEKDALRQKQLQNLIKQKISGSLISKVFELGIQRSNDEKLQYLCLILKKFTKSFKQNQLEALSSVYKSLLFSEMSIHWNQKQRFPEMKIYYNRFTHQSNHQDLKISFIEPNVSKFPGNIIRWRMRIVKLSNCKKVNPWVAMGIGLKYNLKICDFEFDEQENYECYMLSNEGYTFAAYDQIKNNKKGFGFKYDQGDIIEMELDKNKWEIKFRNRSSLGSTKLKILRQPQSDAESYNICVGSSAYNNIVEILSPIQTQFGQFNF